MFKVGALDPKWLLLAGGLVLLYLAARSASTRLVDAGVTAANAVNPANPGNAFNSAANSLFGLSANDPSKPSIGTTLYDVINPNATGAPLVPTWDGYTDPSMAGAAVF